MDRKSSAFDRSVGRSTSIIFGIRSAMAVILSASDPYDLHPVRHRQSATSHSHAKALKLEDFRMEHNKTPYGVRQKGMSSSVMPWSAYSGAAGAAPAVYGVLEDLE